MKSESRALPVALVAAVMVAAMLLALFVGVRRDGLAAELTSQALASPRARVELAQSMAAELVDAAPLLEAFPDLDETILVAINSPILESALPIWMEHSVRYRLGQDVGPLMVTVSDLIQSPNPVLNFGIRTLPGISVTLAPKGTDVVVPALELATPIVLVSAIAATLILGARCGWDRACRLASLGGALAVGGLLALRLAGAIDSELSSIVTSAVVTVPVMFTIGAASSGLGLLGVLMRPKPPAI